KLVDEAYRNGNRNWDRDCEKMWRFVAKQVDDPATFTDDERMLIRDKVDEIIRDKRDPDVSGHGSAHYFVNENVVDWCRAHPDPHPHGHRRPPGAGRRVDGAGGARSAGRRRRARSVEGRGAGARRAAAR